MSDTPLDQLLAHADSYQPVPPELPLKLQPFLPDLVPAIPPPNNFTAPPRPDGQADPLGLTALDEPALVQSDPAVLALQLQHQLRMQGGGSSTTGGDAAALGWLADSVSQPQQLDAWIDQVEALHQADASAATLAPPPPDLDALMQEWSPEMQAHIQSSALPDPRQDVDLATFVRMCCSVLDLQPPATVTGGASSGLHGLVHCLHALFCLYLEFKWNPAFQHRDVFGDQDLI